MLNMLIAVGNVGKDPEMRYTPQGSAVTTFSLATNHGYTQDGERKTETEWFNIVCWNKLAEAVNQHVTKGKRVYVEGRMRTRSWEDNGVRKYKTEVIASRVLFLDRSGNDKPPAEEDDGLPF